MTAAYLAASYGTTTLASLDHKGFLFVAGVIAVVLITVAQWRARRRTLG